MRMGAHGRRLATIDVGSNTILLLLVEANADDAFRVLEERAEITRLGEGVGRNGLLGEGGQARTLEALSDYSSRCRNLGIDEIDVVGTSALREADNAVDFKTRLKADFGWDLRVLSPEEEARYSFLAVQRGLQSEGDEILVVDIGGGSTEFIWGKGSEMFRWDSIEMGSVRLTERFFHSDPVGGEECDQLAKAITEETEGLKFQWKVQQPFQAMVGVAGTFTTLAAVKKRLLSYSSATVHGSSLSRDEIRRQIRLYKSKTVTERRAIPGLDPRRADGILAGSILADRIMEIFCLERVVVSDQGVRYGLLYERLERGRGQTQPSRP